MITTYDSALWKGTLPETLALMVSLLLKEMRIMEADKKDLKRDIAGFQRRLDARNAQAENTETTLRREGAYWRAKAEAAERELGRMKKRRKKK